MLKFKDQNRMCDLGVNWNNQYQIRRDIKWNFNLWIHSLHFCVQFTVFHQINVHQYKMLWLMQMPDLTVSSSTNWIRLKLGKLTVSHTNVLLSQNNKLATRLETKTSLEFELVIKLSRVSMWGFDGPTLSGQQQVYEQWIQNWSISDVGIADSFRSEKRVNFIRQLRQCYSWTPWNSGFQSHTHMLHMTAPMYVCRRDRLDQR